ncbi:hypothetical protein WJX74_008845 [Apatococcus lobatus]|uniref:Kinesin-like protein n=1 Tax=Apatococcus lobatus TaxID=904363 RepID=A0AAW1RX29_9CHLO
MESTYFLSSSNSHQEPAVYRQALVNKRHCKAFVSLRSVNSRSGETGCVTRKTATSVQISTGPLELDGVFEASHDQKELFAATGRPCIAAVKEGRPCAVLNYGQSGSGKSYTTNCFLQLAFQELFKGKSQASTAPPAAQSSSLSDTGCDQDAPSTVRISIVEEYQGKLVDLVDPAAIAQTSSVGLSGHSQHIITCAQDGSQMVDAAMKKRHTGSHKLNSRSSRSHLIIIFHVETTISPANAPRSAPAKTSATFSLVDLAGSEKLRQTQTNGHMKNEAMHINSSLSALQLVFRQLADRRSSHISHRNSQLTMALKDCLSGQGPLNLVGHISSDVASAAETAATLKFVHGARKMEVRRSPASSPTKKGRAELEHANAQLQQANRDLAEQVETLKGKLSSCTASPSSVSSHISSSLPSGSESSTAFTSPSGAPSPIASTVPSGSKSSPAASSSSASHGCVCVFENLDRHIRNEPPAVTSWLSDSADSFLWLDEYEAAIQRALCQKAQQDEANTRICQLESEILGLQGQLAQAGRDAVEKLESQASGFQDCIRQLELETILRQQQHAEDIAQAEAKLAVQAADFQAQAAFLQAETECQMEEAAADAQSRLNAQALDEQDHISRVEMAAKAMQQEHAAAIEQAEAAWQLQVANVEVQAQQLQECLNTCESQNLSMQQHHTAAMDAAQTQRAAQAAEVQHRLHLAKAQQAKLLQQVSAAELAADSRIQALAVNMAEQHACIGVLKSDRSHLQEQQKAACADADRQQEELAAAAATVASATAAKVQAAAEAAALRTACALLQQRVTRLGDGIAAVTKSAKGHLVTWGLVHPWALS